jgi:hypothetical protein
VIIQEWIETANGEERSFAALWMTAWQQDKDTGLKTRRYVEEQSRRVEKTPIGRSALPRREGGVNPALQVIVRLLTIFLVVFWG